MKKNFARATKVMAALLVAMFISTPLANVAAASELISTTVAQTQALELSRHHDRHDRDDDERRYRCNECGRRFDSRNDYKKHYNDRHKQNHYDRDDDHRYRCDECGRRFDSRNDYKKHYNDRHRDHDKDDNGNAVTGFIVGAILGAVVAKNT